MGPRAAFRCDGMPAGLGVVEGDAIPYQPAAAAKKKENSANRATLDPLHKCFLPGVPRMTYVPFPFRSRRRRSTWC